MSFVKYMDRFAFDKLVFDIPRHFSSSKVFLIITKLHSLSPAPHGHPNRVKHFASLNTLPRITSYKNLGVPASSQKGVNRKGQVGVNRSALRAYGTLRRMSSFPRLNKIAQMRPCLSTALCLIVLWPPNPAIARPLLHWLHERVSLGQTNENRGQGI